MSIGALIVGAGCCDTSDEDEGRTSITYWRTLSGGAGDAQDELVASFNAGQDGVIVSSEFQGGYADLATKLMTASVSRRGPEVTQLGTFEIRQFATAGALVDLRPYIDGDDGLDTDGWPSSMLDAGRVGEGIYWLPFNVTAPVLYCNPDALEAAGLDGPPETWSDFYGAVRALTVRDDSGKVTRYGLALWTITWPLLSAIWSEGGELTSRDYADITLDDAVVVEVLREIQALVREGAAILPDRASGGHRAAFVSGRAAMILDSPAPYDEIMKSAAGFVPGVALYPAGRGGRVFAPGGGGIAMMSRTPEEDRDGAWAFMRFMLGDEQIAYYAERSGYLAFTEGARGLSSDWLDDSPRAVIHEALPFLRGDFSVNMSPAIRNAFDEAYRRIVVNLVDVEEALAVADRRAEKEIGRELE